MIDERYSVFEASTLLSKSTTGEIFPLARAVWSGEIPYYLPGEQQKRIGNGKDIIKDWPFYNDKYELYVDDLNKWLSEKHPRVKFRFTETNF